jgi:SAM-dependent methyltransferase
MKLNIGIRNWKKAGWQTMDKASRADIKHDLRNGSLFPLKDNSLEKVFSSHVIEHISDDNAHYMIKEIYRCLIPGGMLRISCPDADMAIKAFKEHDHNWFNATLARGNNLGQKLVTIFFSSTPGKNIPNVSEDIVAQKLNELSTDDFIKWCVSLAPEGNYYKAHINGFDYNKMYNLLLRNGFINIERSEFMQSKDMELRGPDIDMHGFISLFVECNKPVS